jgi:hypothetical protein
MSSKSHNFIYQYTGRSLCFYCRRILVNTTKHKRQSWDGHSVCDSCFQQVSHGIKLKVEGYFRKPQQKLDNPKPCKWCRKNMVRLMANGLYPHFCKDCAEKFKEMVENNPK